MSSLHRRALLAAALALNTAMLAWSAARHSPTLNEPDHLVSGLIEWRTGSTAYYRVNTPLVRLLAALPVMLFCDYHPPEVERVFDDLPQLRREYAAGRRFTAANADRIIWLVIVARWGCMPLSWIGALACYRWARELYGTGSGLTAMWLWCLSPTVLGHAQLIAADVAAAAIGTAACFAFWRWLNQPTWPRTLVMGGWLGLALLTKFTWLVLPSLWLTLWLVAGPRAAGKAAQSMAEIAPTPLRSSRRREIAQLAVALFIALDLVNLCYGFAGTGERLGDYRFCTELLSGSREAARTGRLGNRFANSWLGVLPVPLPHDYVTGIDTQRLDFERGAQSFLRGDVSERGWWYYYLYAFAVKLPCGTLALFALAAGASWWRRYSAHWRNEMCLLVPSVVVLALVSSQTGFAGHSRYALPCLPFWFIWMSKLARAPAVGDKLVAAIAALLLAWTAWASFAYYPHDLSYFNELAGGPLGGRHQLSQSDLDWGQDLLYLRDWLERHPDAKPLRLAYYGSIDPRYAGIEFSAPLGKPRAVDPNGPLERPSAGWYAISVTRLQGVGRAQSVYDGKGGTVPAESIDFTWLAEFTPVGTAGYSIYIYHLSEADIDRVTADSGRDAVKLRSWHASAAD